MFVSRLISKYSTPEIFRHIEPFGDFRYFEDGRYWLCFSENILSDFVLEVTFEVENADQDLSEKVILARKLLQNIDSVKKEIYKNIAAAFADKTIEEVKAMWFLSGISLENNNKNWKIVFEPHFNTETIYNHFLRFTIADRKIIWSSIERQTMSIKEKNIK